MILSMASLVSAPGRFRAGLRHLAAALAVVAFASGTASAQFVEITSNSPANVASQLSYSLVQEDSNTVCFTFRNTGSIESSVTGIYIDDNGAYLTTPVVIDYNKSSSGVLFTAGSANPANLPGGQAVDFQANSILSADSNSPQTSANGINPGEYLTVCYDLQAGVTFASLQTALSSGVVRIGFHVQALPGGASESYVSVPEPASVVMLGMSSLVGVGYAWRRRKQAVS